MQKTIERTTATRPNSETSAPATVASIQLCVKHGQPMKTVTSVRAIENHGLEGDRHARPNTSRQVLLLEQETCEQYGFAMGAIRENITTQGIDLMSLRKGTKLEIGDAVLITTKECEPCSMVDGVRMGLREELQHRRGMLAKVLRGGEMRVGDSISVMEK